MMPPGEWQYAAVQYYDARSVGHLRTLYARIEAEQQTALVRLPAQLTYLATGARAPRYWAAWVYGRPIGDEATPTPGVWRDPAAALQAVAAVVAASAIGEAPHARQN